MTVRAAVRLGSYERGIADALVNDYGYSATEARTAVVHYIHIIRKLGGYDNCEYLAMLTDRARRAGVTPADWLARLTEAAKGELKDKGIGAEESRYIGTK